MKKLLLGLALLCLAGAASAQAPVSVSVTVDLAKKLGPYKPIYAWFGYDEANFTTMTNGRKLLRELAALSPAPVHVRTHFLLSSGDGVAALKWSSTNVYSEDADGKPVYDFHIIDGIFDEYRDAGVTPMFELGFMPKALASGSGAYEDHYPESSTGGATHSPPKDLAKWQEMIRAVTAHMVQRYGRANVAKWYFEVWNEPDIGYWHGTPEQYFDLYDHAVAGVRAALPEAKVGGPATTGPGAARAAKFFDDFLAHVAAKKSPLDFISFHAKGQPRIQGGQVVMGVGKELNDVDKGFAIVAKYPQFKKLPIILSEADPEGCAACSMKVNPANAYRNGTLYPAYTAAAYKRLFELADAHGVNLFSMLSWAFEFENKDYFEGFRSLATNGIDKPVLNIFRMLGLMDGDRVATSSTGQVPLDSVIARGMGDASDIDAMATGKQHEAAVLAWNYHEFDEAAAATPVTIAVTALPVTVHRVLVTHYRIDDSHSNAYTLWQQMGSPQGPTATQYEALKSRDGLELLSSPVWMRADQGRLAIGTVMPRNSVSLLQLKW